MASNPITYAGKIRKEICQLASSQAPPQRNLPTGIHSMNLKYILRGIQPHNTCYWHESPSPDALATPSGPSPYHQVMGTTVEIPDCIMDRGFIPVFEVRTEQNMIPRQRTTRSAADAEDHTWAEYVPAAKCWTFRVDIGCC